MSASLERLQKLVEAIGFDPTAAKEMFIIAMLGSVGQAGEALQNYLRQFHPADVDGEYHFRSMHYVAQDCRKAEQLKKEIAWKKRPVKPLGKYEFTEFKEEELDDEIADELFYLLAKMACRGSSITHYASLAFDRHKRRMNQAISQGVKSLELTKDHHP